MNKNLIYLTQTDTTVGFVSQDHLSLSYVKKRDPRQPFLICVDTLKKQKTLTRTPKKFKSLIRRSKKNTFIYPNKKAIRVVKEPYHSQLLKKFNFLYSSSANEHKKNFNKNYAIYNSDIIIEDKRGFHSNISSKIYKINNYSYKKIR